MVHMRQMLIKFIHQVVVSEHYPLGPTGYATQTIEGSYDTHPVYVDLLGDLYSLPPMRECLHILLFHVQQKSWLPLGGQAKNQ